MPYRIELVLGMSRTSIFEVRPDRTGPRIFRSGSGPDRIIRSGRIIRPDNPVRRRTGPDRIIGKNREKSGKIEQNREKSKKIFECPSFRVQVFRIRFAKSLKKTITKKHKGTH